MKRVIYVFFMVFYGQILFAQSHLELISDTITCTNCHAVVQEGTYSYRYKVANHGDQGILLFFQDDGTGNWVIYGGFNHHVMVIDHDFPENPINYDYLNDDQNVVECKLYASYQETNQILIDDTVEVRITDIALTSRYAQGNNTIVVWPENLSLGGSTEMDSISFEMSVTIPEYTPNITLADQVSVYPNPAFNQIYFHMPSEIIGKMALVEIIDASGRIVKTIDNFYTEIALDGLESGAYSIRFSTKNNAYFTKSLIISK